MANMNFRMVMSLQAQAFKKGIAEVRNEVHNFKNSLMGVGAAIGAGLGFADLISKLKETTKQLSVARATLENVSFETKDAAINTKLYAQNLDFANKLAKKYHQNQIEIIDNFAQFHAACMSTNISLEDQQKIYEALTRAAAYFHMSESRAKDMMVAVTQMISKNVVSSEELRRQLGNALPGAFNMMANAVGVTTAELEKLLKAGKLASGPALIKFADELNKQTQNISFDSVQLKINDLQNAWIKLVDNSGFEQFYKDILDWATETLDSLSDSFSGFFTSLEKHLGSVKSIFLGLGLDKIISGLAAVFQKSIGLIKAGLIGLFSTKIINGFTSAWGKAMDIWVSGQKQKIATLRTEMKSLRAEAQKTIKGTPANIGTTKSGYLQLNNAGNLTAQQQTEATNALSAYNKKLVEANAITQKINSSTKGLRVVWTGVKGIVQGVGQFLKANVYAMIAGAIIGAVATLIGKWREYNQALKESVNIGKNRKKELDEEASSYKSKEALIRTELSIVNDIKRTENERISALNMINEQLGLVGDNQLNIKDGMDKINASTNEWLDRLARGAKMQAYTNELGEVSIAVDKAQKKVDDLIWEINYRNAQMGRPLINREALPEIFDTKDNRGVYTTSGKNLGKYGLIDQYGQGIYRTDLFRDLKLAYNELRSEQEYLKEIEGSVKAIQTEMVKNGDNEKTTANTTSPTKAEMYGETKEKPEKVIDKYNGELAALKASFKEGRLTEEKFNDELIKLIERYLEKYVEAGGSTDNSWYVDLLGQYKKFIDSVKETERLKDIKKTLDNYEKDKLGAKNDGGLDTASITAYGNIIDAAFDYLKDKGIDASKMTVDVLIATFIEELEKAAPELAKILNSSFAEASGTINRLNAAQWDAIYKEYGKDYNKPAKKEDRYRDYKYTGTQKLDSRIKDIDDEIKRKQALIEKLQKLADNGSQKAITDISNLKETIKALRAEADTLEKKATYSEYLDYIEELEKKIKKGSITAMKDFSEVIDRAASSWDNLKDVMEDEDSTWLDKFKAAFNYVVQFATSMGTLTVAIESLQKALQELNAAKDDMAIGSLASSLGVDTTDTLAKQRKSLADSNSAVAASSLAMAEASGVEATADKDAAAAKVMKATAAQGAAVADTASVGASAAAAAASTTEATADSTSAAAKMAKWFAANPLLGAAIAATVIAGVAGVVSSLKNSYGKFANGGIVGYGTSSGDKTLARVNKGEMILPLHDQMTLFKMIKSGQGIGSGGGEWRVRGTDLIKVINNTQNKLKG